MKDINYFMKIQRANDSSSKKETDIRKARFHLENDFNNTIDAEDVLINDNPQRLLITKTHDDYTKKIVSRPNETFHLGDIISWLDCDWIIYRKNADMRISTFGRMIQCNAKLRWLNHDKDIIEKVGYAEDATKYSEGIKENTKIRLSDFQLKIKIPLDEDTIRLKRDCRFLIDASEYFNDDGSLLPSAFICTRVNSITNIYDDKGCLELTLVEDQFSKERDNPTLMVADYYIVATNALNKNFTDIKNNCNDNEIILNSSHQSDEIVYGQSIKINVNLLQNEQVVALDNFRAETITTDNEAWVEKQGSDLILTVSKNKKCIGSKFILHIWSAPLMVDKRITFKIKGYI